MLFNTDFFLIFVFFIFIFVDVCCIYSLTAFSFTSYLFSPMISLVSFVELLFCFI